MFLYGHWVKLPITTRSTIATAFGIPKTGSTHVSGNEVVSDGYKIEDVEQALNLDALQKYLNTQETDFTLLWKMLVDLTEGRTVAPLIIELDAPTATSTVLPPEPLKKKRGRPKKRA